MAIQVLIAFVLGGMMIGPTLAVVIDMRYQQLQREAYRRGHRDGFDKGYRKGQTGGTDEPAPRT